MAFNDIPKIEKTDFYIDVAFRRGTDASDSVRASRIKGTRLDKSRKIELVKLDAVRKKEN